MSRRRFGRTWRAATFPRGGAARRETKRNAFFCCFSKTGGPDAMTRRFFRPPRTVSARGGTSSVAPPGEGSRGTDALAALAALWAPIVRRSRWSERVRDGLTLRPGPPRVPLPATLARTTGGTPCFCTESTHSHASPPATRDGRADDSDPTEARRDEPNTPAIFLPGNVRQSSSRCRPGVGVAPHLGREGERARRDATKERRLERERERLQTNRFRIWTGSRCGRWGGAECCSTTPLLCATRSRSRCGPRCWWRRCTPYSAGERTAISRDLTWLKNLHVPTHASRFWPAAMGGLVARGARRGRVGGGEKKGGRHVAERVAGSCHAEDRRTRTLRRRRRKAPRASRSNERGVAGRPRRRSR